MTAVVLFFVLLLVIVVIFGTAIVMAQKRKLERAMQVVAGVATQAPPSFAGGHTPEALLHRRLRDAMAALQANPNPTDVLQAQAALARQALTIDERLAAMAPLADHRKTQPLAQATAAVDAIEAAVASVLTMTTGSAPLDSAAVDRAVADVHERVALLAEARREVDPGPGW